MPRLAFLLVGVAFFDEWISGVPAIGAPGIQREFGVSYGFAAGGLQTALVLLAVVLEPPLLLLSDRWPRRRFVWAGLALLALLTLAAALAPGYWTLVAVLLLWGPTSGVAVNATQASLMDATPDQRERWLSRWTLLGSMGDLATPLVFAALALGGLGWRTAFALGGVLLAVYSVALSRQRFPDELLERPPLTVPLREAAATALRNRTLVLWTAGGALCALLDEVLFAFGALYLRDALGAGEVTRPLVLGSFTAGGLLGLVVLDRALRSRAPLQLLALSGAGSGLAYAAWLAAPTPAWSALAFAATGFFASMHYPLIKAQAYRALPAQSGAVNAMDSLFAPLSIGVPLLLGVVADTIGLLAALALLAVQPLGVLVLALVAVRRGAA